ncbi:hypothetical protein GCM10007897_31880 [Sphingobium jiangsuense]|uniref:Uncharacterized protein n=1 Tax=Sphingobium jiangsuense TaxID=870476 RepID=A0A7W6FRM4_9SPHN|nr:hypothetical protein [Sphingobium jiangsuense]MBB3928301.1 hypothetical protein [Sphingobium jiangsuense]GLT01790.1 hypothetical protein GCM10007897_31880 [Sphingobium jiangsuense]
MSGWLRLWHDMPTDPKWRTIARKSGQRIGDVIAVFNFILVNASENAAERGALSAFDIEDVASALDLDDKDVQAIIDAMQGKVLDGDRLAGWDKRQPKREDSTASERKKAWKERQKNAAERSGTQGNAPDTDTDTDTDTEYLEAKASCASGEAREPENPEFQLEAEQQTVDRLKPEHFVEAWNDLAGRIAKPKIRALTPERRTRLKARIAGYSLDEFREVLGNIENSAFLRGDKGWSGCTFDWVTKKNNFQKILEGNYNA